MMLGWYIVGWFLFLIKFIFSYFQELSISGKFWWFGRVVWKSPSNTLPFLFGDPRNPKHRDPKPQVEEFPSVSEALSPATWWRHGGWWWSWKSPQTPIVFVLVVATQVFFSCSCLYLGEADRFRKVVATQVFCSCSCLYLGEMIQFDEHIIETGWFNHQLL